MASIPSFAKYCTRIMLTRSFAGQVPANARMTNKPVSNTYPTAELEIVRRNSSLCPVRSLTQTITLELDS